MSECLPDLPRYVRKRGGEWQGADHQNGPWRPIPAPQSGLPWKTDGPAVQSREPASVAADARPLSPAAQAVMDAANGFSSCSGVPAPAICRWSMPTQIAAAALRAVADQVVPPVQFNRRYTTEERWDARDDVRAEILAIAAELEGHHG